MKAAQMTKRSQQESDIQLCLVQLKRMVPTTRRQHKLKKLELLQHVIDYIQDLELTLEQEASVPAPPISSSSTTPLQLTVSLD